MHGGKKMEDNTCLFTLIDDLRIIWEITHKCSYRCVHCCANATESYRSELSTEDVKKGLDNLADFGFNSIYYSGGEPIVRQDFFELVSYTSTLIDSRNINFATNGMLITPEKSKEISRLKIGTVLVSLDGYDKETAQRFRGPENTYENAVNAIEMLANEDVKVRLGVVIWKDNIDHLEDFVKIGIERGADNVFFNWLVPVGRAGKNPSIALDPSAYFNTADELKGLKAKYDGKINVGYHRFHKIEYGCNDCQAGQRILHLLPNGRVTPCSWMYKVDSSLLSQSAVHTTPLESILQEEPFQRSRGIIQSRKEQGLGPGCPAMCNIFGGDYFTFDPLFEEKGLWVVKYGTRK